MVLDVMKKKEISMLWVYQHMSNQVYVSAPIHYVPISTFLEHVRYRCAPLYVLKASQCTAMYRNVTLCVLLYTAVYHYVQLTKGLFYIFYKYDWFMQLTYMFFLLQIREFYYLIMYSRRWSQKWIPVVQSFLSTVRC